MSKYLFILGSFVLASTSPLILNDPFGHFRMFYCWFFCFGSISISPLILVAFTWDQHKFQHHPFILGTLALASISKSIFPFPPKPNFGILNDPFPSVSISTSPFILDVFAFAITFLYYFI